MTDQAANPGPRRLSDQQSATFDTEYVDEARWQHLAKHLERDFPEGNFRFADIGGGNGMFADRLLQSFPNATGVVIEPSPVLLGRNKANERKQLVEGTSEILDSISGTFDVIFVHWVLHHIVGESWAGTSAQQSQALKSILQKLSARGRVSVFENCYEGYVEGLPGRLVYEVTSMRNLARLTGHLGANTAGVGVAFKSSKQWEATFRSTGLDVVGKGEPDNWAMPIKPYWRVGLALSRIAVVHYWLCQQGK